MKKNEIIFKWLNKEFKNLTQIHIDNNVIYYDKNFKNVLIHKYIDIDGHDYYWFNLNLVWCLMEEIFIIDYFEIEQILKSWMIKKYKNEKIFVKSFMDDSDYRRYLDNI